MRPESELARWYGSIPVSPPRKGDFQAARRLRSGCLICAFSSKSPLREMKAFRAHTSSPHSSRQVTCDGQGFAGGGGSESAVWWRSFNREDSHPPSLIRKLTPFFDVKLVKY